MNRYEKRLRQQCRQNFKSIFDKIFEKKTSVQCDNREPGLLIFPLHKRESLSAIAPGNVYFACTSLTCCSNGSRVQVFQLRTCLCLGATEVAGTGNQLQHVSLGHKGNKLFNESARCVRELSVNLSGLLTPSLSMKTMLRAPESPMESVDQPRPLTVE